MMKTRLLLAFSIVLVVTRGATEGGFIGLWPQQSPVDVVLWNQSQAATIEIDGSKILYNGIVPSSSSFPKIVHRERIQLHLGNHKIVVRAPGIGSPQERSFDVRRGTNLHVFFNPHEVVISVSYGPEAYL